MISLRVTPLLLAVVLLVVYATNCAFAQSGTWDTRLAPAPVTNGTINAIVVDGEDVYAGGTFTVIDDVRANYVARWDAMAKRWMPLGGGTDGVVHSIAVSGTRVYVGGQYLHADTIAVRGIAAWDRSSGSWESLGDTSTFTRRWGVGGFYALLADGENLYAGGDHTMAGTQTTFGIFRWNMTTLRWHHVAGGVDSFGLVSAIARVGSRLYVGGYFTWAGSKTDTVNHIAQLDLVGGTWAPLERGVRGFVNSLVPYGGALYVGGQFQMMPPDTNWNLARWNSNLQRWENVGSGLGDSNQVDYLTAMTRDEDFLYVGLGHQSGGTAISLLQRVNLASGEADPYPPSPNGTVYALAVSGQRLYAGGTFTRMGAGTFPAIAVRDLTTGIWSPLAGRDHLAPNGPVRALEAAGTGSVYAGGSFTAVGYLPVNNVALWNGSTWDSLGSGVDGTVSALALLDDRLYVGGDFAKAGGRAAPSVAMWNRLAKSWTALGDAFDGPVNAIAIDTDGLVYAAGDFTRIGSIVARGIAVWNGSQWAPMGPAGTYGIEGVVHALAFADPYLYAGGTFVSAGGDHNISHLARWDTRSRTWSGLGEGVDNTVLALSATGGSLIVGGPFTRAGEFAVGGIARWNGTAWDTLDGSLTGGASVSAITTHGSYLVAAGDFLMADSTPVRRLVGFDGEQWKGIGGGLDSTVYAIGSVGGDLYVGGEFDTAGTIRSSRLAIWHGTAAGIRYPATNAATSATLSVLPNPLRAEGIAQITLAHSSRVRLALMDVSGSERLLLHVGHLGAGTHRIRIPTENLAAGTYLLQLSGDVGGEYRVVVER